MTSTTFRGRSAALLASAGTAAALTLIPFSAANAAVAASYEAAGEAQASYTGTGGGTCTLSSGDDNPTTTPVAFSHGTKHTSVNLNATFTNSLDSSDSVTVKGHLDGALSMKKKSGDLASFAMTSGGKMSINHTITGSDCHGQGDVVSEAVVMFSEHHKGWFYFTRQTKKPNSVVEFVMINTDNDNVVNLDIYQGTKSKVTSRAMIKPGHYEIEEAFEGVVAGGTSVLKSEPRVSRAAQTITVSGQFKRTH